MHQDEGLGAGRCRAIDTGDPRLNVRGRDRLDREIAEGGEELRLKERSIAGDGRGLAASVVLDVAQPLIGGLGKGHFGLDEPRERASTGFIENVPQPSLGGAFGEIARRGTAAIGPGCADLSLHLAPVWEPVLRKPLRPALSLDSENVSRGGLAGAFFDAGMRLF